MNLRRIGPNSSGVFLSSFFSGSTKGVCNAARSFEVNLKQDFDLLHARQD